MSGVQFNVITNWSPATIKSKLNDGYAHAGRTGFGKQGSGELFTKRVRIGSTRLIKNLYIGSTAKQVADIQAEILQDEEQKRIDAIVPKAPYSNPMPDLIPSMINPALALVQKNQEVQTPMKTAKPKIGIISIVLAGSLAIVGIMAVRRGKQ